MTIDEEILAFHRDCLVVDLHSHFLINGHYLGRKFHERGKPPRYYNPFRNYLDMHKAREGGIDCIVFTVYVPFNPLFVPARAKAALAVMGTYERILGECGGKVVYADSVQGIREAAWNRNIASFLAVEGGHMLSYSLENLDLFHQKGVRMLTLVHFTPNDLGDSSMMNIHNGLSRFGKEVVKRMNGLKMMIDVAHMSDKGIRDVLKISTYPVLASHTGMRSLCGIKRNIADEIARDVAKAGGIIGIIPFPPYLKKSSFSAGIDSMIDHIVKAAEVCGAESVAIGSDFDGFTWLPKEFQDASSYPLITAKLLERGFSRPEVRGILGENFLRFLNRF